MLQTDLKYPVILFRQDFAPEGNDGLPPQLLREVAYPADHILISPKPGVSIRQLRDFAQSAGLKPLHAVGGGLMVATASLDWQGVDTARRIMDRSGLTAAAEPDYMVFPCDELEAAQVVQLDQASGGLIDVERQDWVRPQAETAPSKYSPEAVAMAEGAVLSTLPEGGRIVHFDPPEGRIGAFKPEVRMHNFLVTTGAMMTSPYSSVYVQDPYTAGYPNNGGNYLRALSADKGVILEHKDRLPFDAISIDVSEYSTVFTAPKSVSFRGYFANGSSTIQTFTTDGIIDGSGPLKDFQTFTFDDAFRDIVKLEITSEPFMVDNLVVVLKGQETPLPAEPEPPLIYSADWNDAPHTVDAPCAVGGPYAPSSHNFGKAIVRSSYGPLTDRPLELKSIGFTGAKDSYGQIRFDLERHATQYAIEFDFTKTQSDPLYLFFDCPSAFVRLDFDSTITAYIYGMPNATPFGSKPYNPVQANRIRVDFDLPGGNWSVTLNGQVIYTGKANVVSDINAVRFSLSDGAGDGGAAIDNVKIYASGITPPPSTPSLVLTPADRLFFSTIPVGATQIRSLLLANTGSQDLRIESVTSDNPEFQPNVDLPITILPGNRFPIAVNFKPTWSGERIGSLSVVSNDPQHPTKQIQLYGTATGVPSVTLTPTALDVSTVAGSFGTGSFTIGNVGSGNLSWSLVQLNSDEPLPTPESANDPHFSLLWGIRGSEFAGCDATRAWTLTTGRGAGLVAVLDTGASLSHPDLVANLAKNSNEIAGNGIDDDHNGFIDDVDGWDFATDDNSPEDGHGHGTHVSGTICASRNNAKGIAGVAPDAKVLPVQFLSAAGSGYTSDAIAAVDYARIRGASIINASWGGSGPSSLLSSAIYRFVVSNNGLFIAAAGNSGTDNDTYPFYPAAYPDVLAVAASDSSDRLAYFSNFGFQSVALAAPGVGILSCYRNGSYAYMNGTSMAAPHVAATAALILSVNATATRHTLKSYLLDWTDRTPALNGRSSSGGRLNAYRSLIRVPQGWLNLSSTSGSVPPGGTEVMTLGVDARAKSPGLYKASLALSTNDPARGNVFLPVDVKVLPPSSISSWKQQNFGADQLLFSSQESTLWSNAADPDGDGLSNLLEYLFGQSPLGFSPARSVVERNGAGFAYRFATRSNTEGVDFQVEWSETLENESWNSGGLLLQSTGTEGSTTWWKASFADPAFAPAQCFFRVSASEVP